VQVDAFLAPGHVNAVMGYWEYEALVREFPVPMVVTGFEPVDLMRGILMIVKQLEEGRAEVENAYERAVTREGNVGGQQLISEVFELTDRKWRGIGVIPMSGYKLRDAYSAYDAERRFPDVATIETEESPLCISGQILKGLKKPVDCAAFGKECTPQNPLGATMVSSEGACAAYYRYGRFEHSTSGT
jgi:hydrogenase expression/formation protein HypD